jgi:hypothetical protein
MDKLETKQGTLPMLSSDSIDNTAKSKADSERKRGVNDKI